MSSHINVEKKNLKISKNFETKRCDIIHLNVPNLLQFYEKIPFKVKKCIKL
jgi:hypothetical protein